MKMLGSDCLAVSGCEFEKKQERSRHYDATARGGGMGVLCPAALGRRPADRNGGAEEKGRAYS